MSLGLCDRVCMAHQLNLTPSTPNQGFLSKTSQHTLMSLTFHFDVPGASVSRLDSILVLVIDGHVGEGRAHGVSGAVAVGGVVHVVHGRSQVRLQGGSNT